MRKHSGNIGDINLDSSNQLRVIEAILFASSDPVDKKTLSEKLPNDADIDNLITFISYLFTLIKAIFRFCFSINNLSSFCI